MVNNRVYRGKVIAHTLWKKHKGDLQSSSIDVSGIEMSPGLAGAYTFKAKARNSTKSYIHHGRFNKAVISNNRMSFFVTRPVNVNGRTITSTHEATLIIEFEEGEVTRLLSEDRWFKNESWFKVVVEDLQLSIF